MYFYILSPYVIEALEYNQTDFVSDDLLAAIQSGETLVATTEDHFNLLKMSNPKHVFYYRVGVERVNKISDRKIPIAV